MLVLMRLAKKYAVPEKLALLYEFLNSTDLRTYVEKGVQHVRSDELETPAQLENWMRERGLLKRGELLTAADHQRSLELRSAMRTFLQLPPDSCKSRESTRGQQAVATLPRPHASAPYLPAATDTASPDATK